MRRTIASVLAAATFAGTAIVATQQASAASFAAPAAAISAAASSQVEEVQYRRYGRGYYAPRGHYRRGPSGGAVAAGVLGGLALGAIAAGAASQAYAAPPPVAVHPEWVDYCYSKYRSYDPRTNTYLGYDGRRHVCR